MICQHLLENISLLCYSSLSEHVLGYKVREVVQTGIHFYVVLPITLQTHAWSPKQRRAKVCCFLSLLRLILSYSPNMLGYINGVCAEICWMCFSILPYRQFGYENRMTMYNIEQGVHGGENPCSATTTG